MAGTGGLTAMAELSAMAEHFPAGRLAYGMQLPVQAQSAVFAEPWEVDADPGDLVEIARTADRAGFAYLAACDHVAIPRRLADAMGTTWYDPVATLSFLAGVTERVRLLSHVAIVGLRHPLIGAKQYATLDHLSGGRLILGVGAGHVAEEFDVLGADFAGRGPLLDETADVTRVLAELGFAPRRVTANGSLRPEGDGGAPARPPELALVLGPPERGLRHQEDRDQRDHELQTPRIEREMRFRGGWLKTSRRRAWSAAAPSSRS